MNEYFYETSTQYTFQTTTLSIRMKVVHTDTSISFKKNIVVHF